MKVLEAPAKPTWSLKFTCASCGAKLKAEVADVKDAGYDVGDYYHVAYAVPCPLCKEKRALTENEIDAYENAKVLAKANKKLPITKSK